MRVAFVWVLRIGCFDAMSDTIAPHLSPLPQGEEEILDIAIYRPFETAF